MQFRDVDLAKLNTLTKYPSIQTYHAMGGRGRLTAEVISLEDHELHVSEKIDGTNTRVLMNSQGQFIVGSRNDLLGYSGDLLHNPAQGIVQVMSDRVGTFPPAPPGGLRVFFGESFGGKITAQSKQYSRTGQTGFRLFDVLEFEAAQLATLLERDRSWLSTWREAAGQPFVATTLLGSFGVPLSPRLVSPGPIPTTHQGALDWLNQVIPRTQVGLDDTALGSAEGVIVRTDDRSKIVKLRFQDYRRTLK